MASVVLMLMRITASRGDAMMKTSKNHDEKTQSVSPIVGATGWLILLAIIAAEFANPGPGLNPVESAILAAVLFAVFVSAIVSIVAIIASILGK